MSVSPEEEAPTACSKAGSTTFAAICYLRQRPASVALLGEADVHADHIRG